MTHSELLALFFVMGIATFLTRSVPFFIQNRVAGHVLLKQFSRRLPPMIVTVLVFFSFTGLSYETNIHTILTIAAVLGTITVHFKLRNPLFSIVFGSSIYAAGLRMFAENTPHGF